MDEQTLRRQIIATAVLMNESGLNQGTSGNISARYQDGYLITPSALPYDETAPTDIVYMDFGGKHKGEREPSSEWRFHHDIFAARPEVNAIVHTHSNFATSLACLKMEIPAFHYMIAVAGGKNIRCADYATFGTQQLSDNALKALQDRKACLLANHGMIVVGKSLKSTYALAIEVETLAAQYWRALQIGKPNLLSDTEMDGVLEKFKTYGQK